MTQALAEELAEAAEGLMMDAEMLAGYSGRSMFGATTAALVVDNLLDVAAIAAFAAADNPRAVDLANDLRMLRSDQLGRRWVVY